MPTAGKPKTIATRSARRREDLRRLLPRRSWDWRVLLERPELINVSLICLVFLGLASLLVVTSREQIHVQPGQIMTETRLNRVAFTVPDEQATEAKREEARKSAPRIYVLNESYLGRLEAALTGLPKAVARKTSLDEISDTLRDEFDLSEEALAQLQMHALNDEPSPQWLGWVNELIDQVLPANPMIASQEYQVFSTTARREWRGESIDDRQAIRGDAIELKSGQQLELRLALEELALQAEFPRELAPNIAAYIAADPQPTFLYDSEGTALVATQRAQAVAPVVHEHQAGEIIYARGDHLSLAQFDLLRREVEQFRAVATTEQRWLPRLGVIGLITTVTILLAGYFTIFYPKLTRNPLRVAALCALITAMLAITVLGVVEFPSLLYPALVAPTLVVAIIALLAYEQRLALFISSLQCTLVVLALEQSVALYILLFAGCAAAVAQLRELRHRNTLIRAATVTAVILGAGAVMLGMVEIPPVEGAWWQITTRALGAATASFAIGFLMLGVLPSVERLFDITTGMTLAELRDPKQPLLRQLQQKAPGTYNHSLQVANIAEAAAESIGADGLLTYVGALYHDIGKMNKPEYFVENQSGGFNKHERLSPAMSLLVIVGHVKDGIELAREYNLPRAVQHFIESHHGTTLVEYFYHAAKSRASAEEKSSVEEVEFRYPGPKPRTKEAAILMLADAVESATRTMAEPNPRRVETFVRELARKRLRDGQFDQCDLTFRELNTIADSIIKSINAIYHGRISYPEAPESDEAEPPPQRQQPTSLSA